MTTKDTVNGVATTVAVGARIIGDSTGGAEIGGAFGTVACNEKVITGIVAKNNGTEAQETVEAGYPQGSLTTEDTKCASALGPVTVTIPALTIESGKSHWCIRTVPNTEN